MDKIREALQSELERGKLSEQSKKNIVKKSRKTAFRFVPVVTLFAAAISLFLAWGVWQTDSVEQTDTRSKEYVDMKDLAQSIVTYTNELLQAEAAGEFYLQVGESYPLRLALEKNSGLFYSDVDLTQREKMLLSEFLHYLQNVHILQLNTEFQPVETLEELVQQAPAFIERWATTEKTFKPIEDEQKNPKLAAFGLLDWLMLFGVLVVSVYTIVKLWRKHYRIPSIIWGIILILSVSSLFLHSRDYAYDETSMVRLMEEGLEASHVRIVGEPTVEALAGNSLNRYMLLSYEDGLQVLGAFTEEDGFFYWRGNSWGAYSTFLEHSNIQSGQFESVQIITYIVPPAFEHSTVKMDVEGEMIQFDVPKDEASIWMYRSDGRDIQFIYE